jgi:hypothetical protein
METQTAPEAKRPITSYASIQEHSSYLSTDFGLQLAVRKLDLSAEKIEELLGRYSKGKRKGELKGKLVWFKVAKGGWVKTGAYDYDAMQGNGFVARPGVTFGYHIVDSWTGEVLAVSSRCVTESSKYSRSVDAVGSYRLEVMHAR